MFEWRWHQTLELYLWCAAQHLHGAFWVRAQHKALLLDVIRAPMGFNPVPLSHLCIQLYRACCYCLSLLS
jgi:hypothetical protein